MSTQKHIARNLPCASSAFSLPSGAGAAVSTAHGWVFWAESTEFFGPKSGSMALARLFRVYIMPSEQGQPSVQAPGALAAEQGHVGVEGRSEGI
jgi:hypothetical protein